ncbi:MAG: riboflavin synthase [Actinomycetota bacterium]
MFTGIVEERGNVRSAGSRLEIIATKVAEDSAPGASLAVNGVCLTVVERRVDEGGEVLAFDLSPETLDRTALSSLRPGDPVNLERPVTLLSRLGGHLVQGHVDGVGEIEEIEDSPPGKSIRVKLPDGLARYVVEKGSISIDGVSLTVTDVRGDAFGVALVPFTLDATSLGSARPGDRVNVEVDVVAKYVEGLLKGSR